MLIDHCDLQIVRRKTRNLQLCFGTILGTNHAVHAQSCPKLRKSRFLERFSSDSCVLWSVPYDVKLIRATGGAKRDPLFACPKKCWGTCGCARAFSRCMWRRRTRAQNWEHVCTQHMMSRTIGCVMAHATYWRISWNHKSEFIRIHTYEFIFEFMPVNSWWCNHIWIHNSFLTLNKFTINLNN